MLKKSLMVLSICMLVGCSSSNVYSSAKPLYKISDEETKKWIIEGNKFEQCLFPKVVEKQTLSHLSKEEQFLHDLFVWGKSLQNIVGDNIAKTIFNDNASKNYAKKKIIKFNHTQKAEFSKQWCANVKKEYNTGLKHLKIEIKKAKEAELARQKQAEKVRKTREAYLKTPAGQMELARMQQERQHQEMMALQRQQLAQQRAMQDQMEWQQFNQQLNQFNQQIQQINQSNMQMMQQMTPRRVIVTPAYQAPCFGTGPCWNNVY